MNIFRCINSSLTGSVDSMPTSQVKNSTDIKMRNIVIGAMILLSSIGLATASIGLFTANPLIAATGVTIALIGGIGILFFLHFKSHPRQNNEEVNQHLPSKQPVDIGIPCDSQKQPLENLDNDVYFEPSEQEKKELLEGCEKSGHYNNIYKERILASPSLLKDYEFMLSLIKIHASKNDYRELPNVWEMLDSSLKLNKNFVLECLKFFRMGGGWNLIDSSLRKDRDFMLKACLIDNYRAQCIMSSELKKDPSFILEAMKTSPDIYNKFTSHYPDSSLATNHEFLLEAMMIDDFFILGSFTSLKDNEEFMLKVIAIDYKKIRFSDKLCRDKDFIMQAIAINPKVIYNIYFPLRLDFSLLSKALEKDPQLIAGDDFRFYVGNNASLLAIGLKEDPSLFRYIKQDARINAHIKEEACIMAGLPRDGIGG